MAGFGEFDNRTWDRFFDLTDPDVTELSIEEVRATLKREGVDLTESLQRIKHAVETARARRALEKAPARRQTLLGLMRRVGTERVRM